MAHGKRDKTKTLDKQVYDTLQTKNGIGRSKHDDKILGITDNYIYSFNTFKTYQKHCVYFVKWCKENKYIRDALGHKPRTLEECKPYVEAFIRHQESRELSAYTIKMEKSAIEKLYGEKFSFDTKRTSRSDIVRSRNEVVRDKHFSEEKNAELVNACKHVGFRRSELTKCKSTDLINRDSQYYVVITGKGGRCREAPILDNDLRTITYIANLNGNNHVHNGADIHSYRADYATSIYEANAKPIESLKGKMIDYTALTGKIDKDGNTIYKSALYYCRGDRKGDVLDRAAMIKASQALGHNRESIVGEHYIRV